jgi:hypothetical protein
VRGFAPLQLKSALDFLSVPSSRHAELIRTVEALRGQLAVVEKT